MIGVSTGVVRRRLGSLAGGDPGLSSPVPILIVQHMPAAFTQRLASRLDAGVER